MADFDRFMQELKAKNDIVDVIGSYVAIDRKGGNHWACCPFHHERTPSFAVNQSEQFYHCFGCGESGDVVKFVKEMEEGQRKGRRLAMITNIVFILGITLLFILALLR